MQQLGVNRNVTGLALTSAATVYIECPLSFLSNFLVVFVFCFFGTVFSHRRITVPWIELVELVAPPSFPTKAFKAFVSFFTWGPAPLIDSPAAEVGQEGAVP